MPSTAKKLSLDEHLIFRPKENIATAAKLIRQLQNQFAYIHDKEEQIQFILAAYNGGIGHVNDARGHLRKNMEEIQISGTMSVIILSI